MPRKKTRTSTKSIKKVQPTEVPRRVRRLSIVVPVFSFLFLLAVLALFLFVQYWETGSGISSPSIIREDTVSSKEVEDFASIASEEPSLDSSLSLSATSVEDRLIIQTGDFTITVEKSDNTIEDLEDIAESLGGNVESSYRSSNTYVPCYQTTSYYEASGLLPDCYGANAVVVLRIPSESFSDARSDIEKLDLDSEFDEESTSSVDTTDEVIDIEARLKSLGAEEGALQDLLGQAEDLDQVLTIRRELTSVRSQIEALQGQLADLEDQVSYSRMTIYVNEEVDDVITEVEYPSLSERFEEAWVALKDDFQGILSGGVYLVVYALIYIPLIVILYVIVHLVMVKRHKKQ